MTTLKKEKKEMATAEMATEKAKKKFKFPTAFTILVLITFVVAVLTRVIPAGRV